MGFKTGFSKSTWGKGLCFLQRVKQMGKVVKSILHLLMLGNPYSYSSPNQRCATAGCWGPRGGQGCLRYSPPCGAPGSAELRMGQAPHPCPERAGGGDLQHPREAGDGVSARTWAQILVSLLDWEKWHPCCENENIESFWRGTTARNHWVNSLDPGVVSLYVFTAHLLLT